MNEKRRVLIVDDDPEFRKAMGRMFERSGYDVEIAGDGQEALKEISNKTYDLIISDLRMPKLDGVELMGEIRRRGLVTPIIFLTAYGEVESYMDLMNLGAFEYVNKPVKSQEILDVARRAIEAHGISGQVPSA